MNITKNNELKFAPDNIKDLQEEFSSKNATEKEKNWKPKALVIDTGNIEIQDICRRLEEEQWNISPEFQRNFIWSKVNGSKFIESLLINITIPPIYIFETENSNFDVIDGVQRLTTIKTFLNNEWKLRGLESFELLNGKKFDDLNANIKGYLKTQILQTIRIRKNSDESLKFDIFSRLNQGSMKLNSQELRNAIYGSDLNLLIKKFVKKNVLWLKFENLPENSIFIKRMKNVELIFRFLAFSEKIKITKNHADEIKINILNYNGRIIYLINDYMKFASKNSSNQNEQIISNLEMILENLKKYFNGIEIFRIYSLSVKRNEFIFDKKINVALAEATLILFENLDFNKITIDQFQKCYKSLFTNPENRDFYLSLRVATGNNNTMSIKYETIFNVFKDYLIY